MKVKNQVNDRWLIDKRPRQDLGFQKMEAFFLLVNLRERNAELEWVAVSGEDRYVTTLITAAKETKSNLESNFTFFWWR